MGAALHQLVCERQHNYPHRSFQVDSRRTGRQLAGARRALSVLEAAKRYPEPEAAEKVSRLLNQHTSKHPLPPLIVRFLQQHCQPYLVRLYVLEGGRSRSWRDATDNIEKLVWSVQPKYDDVSRKLLFSLLPDLYQWGHGVLKSQQLTAADTNAFFAQLARLNAATLDAKTHRADASPDLQANPSFVLAKQTECQFSAPEEKKSPPKAPSPLHPQAGEEPPPSASKAEANQPSEIRIGHRVEFRSSRGKARLMQLRWISRNGSVYLFSDDHAGGELFVTAARLRQRIGEHSARVLCRSGDT